MIIFQKHVLNVFILPNAEGVPNVLLMPYIMIIENLILLVLY
jgi:hypothetical protein